MQPKTIALGPVRASAEELVSSELAEAVGQRTYEHWFQGKTTLEIQDDELTVGVASPFLVDWFQKQFREPAGQVAKKILGPSARVRFLVNPSVPRAQPESGEQGRAAPSRQPESPPQPRRRKGRRFADLSDFVKGQCNELALAAAGQVCEAPAAKFNPLFIHGPVGTGKTHLLEGTYRRLRRNFPHLQVMFLTSEAFANYFTDALRNHTLPSFRQRFRSVDILLVDDVDFLDGKRVIQEEFLHTFKQLVSHGRQLVVTGGRHPRLSTKISDELKTRFLSGMVCRVEAPDTQTRLEIVRHKALGQSGKFTNEVLEFIAERFQNNVRELEGAINCLQMYHRMTGKPVGLGTAMRVLADLERDCIRVIRIADVEEAVCSLFGVEATNLKSAKRSRSVSQPRMLAMYLARKHTRAAYSEIGGYFGGRNHSTVISAEKKIDDLIKSSATLQIASQAWSVRDVLETLEQQLRVS